ncbi:MAG: PKD domain-containing protein, partial [Bacteroidetes bacterium]|nr:PKD domain-containing protein [Bacteroidota bacterium]
MKLNFYFTGAALLLVQAGFIYGQNPLPVSQKQATREWVTLMEDPNANFYDIKQKFEEYWQGKTIRPGKGWKPFKRWENFWESRVFPSGTFPKPSIAYEEFTQYKNLQASLKSMLPDNSNWTALGPSVVPTNGGAGRINCIRFHPTNTNIIFIGAASGGLWKTTDGGSTWSSNTDGLQVLGVTDFLIDPTNTNIMYLATGDGDAGDTYSVGVLKSTDGGATWNATGLSWTVNQGRRISKMIMHPSNSSIILAATSNGVYKTINGGTSWTQELVANIKDIEFKPGDPTVVYAARIAFYKSTDTGDNFSQITSGVPTSNVGRFAIGVTANDATYVYLLASNDTDDGLLGVYRSTDSGNNFSTRATTPNLLGWDYDGSDAGGQGWYDLSIAVNPFNKDDVYVGGVNHWRSTNGGTSWTSISHWYGCCGKPYVHADVHALEFLPGSSTTIFSGNDGGFFKTTNNGTSWSDLSAGLSVTQIYRLGLSATNANLALNGNQDNGTNRVSSGTWTRVIGGDGMECIIDYNNANTMYGELYYGEIRKSTNGGSSFSSTIVYSGGSGVDEDGDWVTPYIMHPTNSSTLLVGKSQVYKTTDGGTNWSQIGTISGGTGNIIALAYAPSDPVNIYAAKRDKLYYSSNSGSTWNDRTSGLPVASASITYIAVDPANTQRVWVTFSGYSSGNKVYYSSNAGTSWSNFSGTLPNIPANTIVYEQGSSDGLYIGMDVGVYYRNSSMGDWQTFMNNLPNVIVNELEIHYGSSKIRAATYGRGLWESPLYSAGTPPVAQFSASKTAVCGGLTINFTDLSTNSPTSWSWTINGGTPSSSTAQNPSGVVFNTPGTYTISLIATNAAGNDTETKTNYITVNNCSTKVRTADCGITLSDLNQAIYCDPVSGATNWEWEWVHAASGFSKTVLRN